MMEINKKVALEREIAKLEAQISVMERAGINVSSITALMEELKVMVQNGQYDEAKELMNQIKAMIRDAYQNGRQAIRDSAQKTHGMRPSRP